MCLWHFPLFLLSTWLWQANQKRGNMKPFYRNPSQHWPHQVLLYGNKTLQHFLSAGTAVSKHFHSHFPNKHTSSIKLFPRTSFVSFMTTSNSLIQTSFAPSFWQRGINWFLFFLIQTFISSTCFLTPRISGSLCNKANQKNVYLTSSKLFAEEYQL